MKETIKKNIDETNKYTKIIEEKKRKEKDELLLLKDELDSIKYEQGKIQNENLNIKRELEEKKHSKNYINMKMINI